MRHREHSDERKAVIAKNNAKKTKRRKAKRKANREKKANDKLKSKHIG